MITISKNNNHYIFKVNGMHQLWAFKSELSIPAEKIINAHQDTDTVKGWKGWRAPGTHVPSIITAGTFYKDGNKIFWDVSDIKKAIIVNLKDEDYKQLIIEVENPEEALRLLNERKNDKAIGKRSIKLQKSFKGISVDYSYSVSKETTKKVMAALPGAFFRKSILNVMNDL